MPLGSIRMHSFGGRRPARCKAGQRRRNQARGTLLSLRERRENLPMRTQHFPCAFFLISAPAGSGRAASASPIPRLAATGLDRPRVEIGPVQHRSETDLVRRRHLVQPALSISHQEFAHQQVAPAVANLIGRRTGPDQARRRLGTGPDQARCRPENRAGSGSPPLRTTLNQARRSEWGGPEVSPPARSPVASALLRHLGFRGDHGRQLGIRNSRQLPRRRHNSARRPRCRHRL